MQTVDIDLIGNTMREPERERLSLILNELGTGLAGRGRDLNEVIRRANPALQETDKVLAILARQNTQLEQLAVNSDTVLAPLARDRATRGGRDPQLELGGQGDGREERRARGGHPDAAEVPRRAPADDGAPRIALGPDHAAARRPARARRRHQQRRAPARAVLDGRDPGGRIARRGVQDRHARGGRRAARDRRPARPGQGRAAGGRDAAAGARVLPGDRRDRAPDGLHLLPGVRRQRLRRGRVL